MTTATLTATTRFHVGLHVSDLGRSVRFYEILFGHRAAKHFDDYAKFDVAEPPLVLALYPSPQMPGGALNHVGLRLTDSEGLVAIQRRLEEAGIATQRQEGVECCYARQTKFWVTDPDKTLWELYTLHEDLEHSGFDNPPMSPDAVGNAIWEHRLTEPIPLRIEHCAGSLDVVRLEGTFNARHNKATIAVFLREIERVLRPGGQIEIHGLVGDRPFPGEPKLPGIASLVRRVPVESEALNALETAGFVGMTFEKLGDIHCFRVGDVELREMRLLARKPFAALDPKSATVVYKGPFERVTDDEGNTFERGRRVHIGATTAERLRRTELADQFVFLV